MFFLIVLPFKLIALLIKGLYLLIKNMITHWKITLVIAGIVLLYYLIVGIIPFDQLV